MVARGHGSLGVGRHRRGRRSGPKRTRGACQTRTGGSSGDRSRAGEGTGPSVASNGSAQRGAIQSSEAVHFNDESDVLNVS